MRRTQTIYQEDSLGTRIGKFIAMLGIICAVTFTVVVTSQFQPETLALITGLALAGIPLLVVLGLVIFIAFKAVTRPRQQQPQQMTIPPIIMQMPSQQPMLPDYWGGTQTFHQSQGNSQRAWEVVGNEGEDYEQS